MIAIKINSPKYGEQYFFVDAALAYNNEAKKLYGDFFYLNDIKECR